MQIDTKIAMRGIFGILVSLMTNSCGTTASGVTEDGSMDVLDDSSDAVHLSTDVQSDGVDSAIQPDVATVPWQQPSMRITAQFVTTVSTLAVSAAIRPPFIADGRHGFERTVDGCNLRRMEGWPRVDIGPIEVSYGARLGSTSFYPESGSLLRFEGVSPIDGAVVTVAGGGNNHVGRFNLNARIPPLFQPIFPPAHPSNIMRPLPVPQDVMLQWVPITTPYTMLVEITAFEANDVLIKVYCHTSAATGAFQLPNSVVAVLRNARDVSLWMGLSDEVQMQVGLVPVLLTTVYFAASMGFR